MKNIDEEHKLLLTRVTDVVLAAEGGSDTESTDSQHLRMLELVWAQEKLEGLMYDVQPEFRIKLSAVDRPVDVIEIGGHYYDPRRSLFPAELAPGAAIVLNDSCAIRRNYNEWFNNSEYEETLFLGNPYSITITGIARAIGVAGARLELAEYR